MNKEQKQEFTRRISSANRGNLVVVTYDIFFTYCDEVENAFGKDDYPSFKEALKKAQSVVSRLMETLDFTYPVSKELHVLYQFVNEKLSESLYKKDIEVLAEIKTIMKNLYDGFVEAAAKDLSEPLMKHAQQVVAGMTYHKGNLTETLQDSDNSRGFLA